jgi:chromosome segregation and condensation protein ScpB
MSNRDDEAFAMKILELIVAAGDDGVERQELVAATGASMERVAGTLKWLRAGAYVKQRLRAKH